MIPEVLESQARVKVSVNGTKAGIRREIDFVPGSTQLTITGTESATGEKVTITIDLDPDGVAALGLRYSLMLMGG